MAAKDEKRWADQNEIVTARGGANLTGPLKIVLFTGERSADDWSG